MAVDINEDMVGILSERGVRQKLVLAPNQGEFVGKIAVGGLAHEALRREYVALEAVRHTPLHDVAPTAVWAGTTLLIERLPGSHPSWQDENVHHWLLNHFVYGSSRSAPCHGDIAPWNIIMDVSSIHVIDWEKAEPCREVEPVVNLLDYVIRGAIVADAPQHEVCAALGRLADRDFLDRDTLIRALREYPNYRATIHDAESDALGAVSSKIGNALLVAFENCGHHGTDGA